MKKLKYLFTFISFIVLVSSCEKDELVIKSETTNDIDKPDMVRRIELANCQAMVNGTIYLGYSCYTGIRTHCIKDVPCHPIEYPGGWVEYDPDLAFVPEGWDLTEDEITRFNDGDNIIQYNEEWILAHYQMMLDFYNMGITSHPDELLEQL